ncbi:MAG: DUF4124 domain-containing protein [Nitrospira defluvii]|nr:DUF4124 domain-containing protein [Nitrospira defluvii]
MRTPLPIVRGAIAVVSVWMVSAGLGFGVPAAAQAELYTWADEQGSVHLSEVPPEGKKAKRYWTDKGCTIREHVPNMTKSELNRFVLNMFNTPYLRADMTGPYRDLYDEVQRANAACNDGDPQACECLRGDVETNKTKSFAPEGNR